jgi:recombinational DNA repair ATPase RecF
MWAYAGHGRVDPAGEPSSRWSIRHALWRQAFEQKSRFLKAIHKEQQALLGLGKHLHDYSGAIAAVNAQAQAQLDELHATIARTFMRARADEGIQADIIRTGPIASREQQELERNRLESLRAKRQKREQLQDVMLDPAEIDSVVEQIGRQYLLAARILTKSLTR